MSKKKISAIIAPMAIVNVSAKIIASVKIIEMVVVTRMNFLSFPCFRTFCEISGAMTPTAAIADQKYPNA